MILFHLCANVQMLTRKHCNVLLVLIQHERRSIMPLIQIVIVLVVFGVILWAINTYIPMDGTIKKILNVVVILVVILFVLSAFGLLGSMQGIRVG